jgi:hypothetical protein
VIGRSKSWLWWLAGCLCAVLFGGANRAPSAEPPQPPYGVPPPPPPLRRAEEEQKQKADSLIDEYLAQQTPAATPEDLKAKIDKLVKELGADEWAARENASKELLKIGKPALPALKEALKSKDPEVATRAKDLVEKVEGSGSAVDQLRALGPAGQAAVQLRVVKERRTVTSSAGAAGEAELAGKKDEAEKFRAEAKKAQTNVAALTKLLGLLAQAPAAPAPGPGPVQALYGVRVMIERN